MFHTHLLLDESLMQRTAGISEPERLTQRKSTRLIEGFVCIP